MTTVIRIPTWHSSSCTHSTMHPHFALSLLCQSLHCPTAAPLIIWPPIVSVPWCPLHLFLASLESFPDLPNSLVDQVSFCWLWSIQPLCHGYGITSQKFSHTKQPNRPTGNHVAFWKALLVLLWEYKLGVQVPTASIQGRPRSQWQRTEREEQCLYQTWPHLCLPGIQAHLQILLAICMFNTSWKPHTIVPKQKEISLGQWKWNHEMKK